MSLNYSLDRTISLEWERQLLPLQPIQCRCDLVNRYDSKVRLLGLNHRSADVAARSKMAIQGSDIPQFLDLLKQEGVEEAVILSTCNRTEIYVVGGSNDASLLALAKSSGMEIGEVEKNIYKRSGVCAACHLFRVTSGLDSAVIGESEIVTQVKEAVRLSSLVGPVLRFHFDRALEASKKVRTETNLCKSVTSIGSLAIQVAKAQCGPLSEQNVLVLGAGKVAQRILKELETNKARKVTVLNRTVSRGGELAGKHNAEWGSLEAIPKLLEEVDVVFAAASVHQPLIDHAMVPRGRNPLFIDLGIPSNVDKANLRVVDVDDLSGQCATNNESRIAAVPQALAILEGELERLIVSLTEREAATTIKKLSDYGEEVRQRTLDLALAQLPGLEPKEKRIVENLTRRIVQGLLVVPFEELKKGEFSPEERRAIERAFCLSPGESDN
jgi:glutamyl-tRNA reductase